jgi:hypothetical protein
MPIFHLSMTLWRCKEYVLTKRPNELNTLHGTMNQNTTTEEAVPSQPKCNLKRCQHFKLPMIPFFLSVRFFPPPTSEGVRFRGGVDIWERHTIMPYSVSKCSLLYALQLQFLLRPGQHSSIFNTSAHLTWYSQPNILNRSSEQYSVLTKHKFCNGFQTFSELSIFSHSMNKRYTARVYPFQAALLKDTFETEFLE